MTDIKKENDQNLPFQTKVFTRWVSNELKGIPNSNINDITKDLSNGVILVELAQALTHKKAPRDWIQHPTTNDQNQNNCKIALKMFGDSGVNVNGITLKDFVDNKEKQIISFIWQLISHYSIDNSFGNLNNFKENIPENNINSKLLSWAIKKTQTYKNVFAFKPYDLAMCALLDSYYPSKIKYYVLNLKDHQKNFKLIIDVMEELGIPCLIYPEDLSQNNNQVDQKALLTQLSIVRTFLEVKPHMREKLHADSVIQKKFDSQLPNNSTPQKAERRAADKKLIANQENLLHLQIQAKRKAQPVLKTKKEKANFMSDQKPIEKVNSIINGNENHNDGKSDKKISMMNKNNHKRAVNKKLVRNINNFEKEKVPLRSSGKGNKERIEQTKVASPVKGNKEQQKIEKRNPENKGETVSELNGCQTEDEQRQTEKQISEEFHKNVESYNERKQEEASQKAPNSINSNRLQEQPKTIHSNPNPRHEQLGNHRNNNNDNNDCQLQAELIQVNQKLISKNGTKGKELKVTKKQLNSIKGNQQQQTLNAKATTINKEEQKDSESGITNENCQIEKQISNEFRENIEAFNERKQEEQEAENEEKAETANEQREIEKQILAEFKENIENYNERKQEEKIEKDKENHPTKEQLEIERQLSEEFKENREAFNERKQEEKIEAEKQENLDKPIEKQISEEFRENIENFNERKQEEKIEKDKEKQPTKEQLEIQKEISEEFKENREAFNERKQEEIFESKKLENLDKPIEKQISEEFKENIKNFNERKQEEKIEKDKEKQPTKEQLEIEKKISQEFKENIINFNERKQEEKIEKQKIEKDENGKRFGINNRPDWRP